MMDRFDCDEAGELKEYMLNRNMEKGIYRIDPTSSSDAKLQR